MLACLNQSLMRERWNGNTLISLGPLKPSTAHPPRSDSSASPLVCIVCSPGTGSACYLLLLFAVISRLPLHPLLSERAIQEEKSCVSKESKDTEGLKYTGCSRCLHAWLHLRTQASDCLLFSPDVKRTQKVSPCRTGCGCCRHLYWLAEQFQSHLFIRLSKIWSFSNYQWQHSLWAIFLTYMWIFYPRLDLNGVR